ncbi:MAG: hypothetical protein ACOCQB_00585 [Halanaerobiaceae bacterium]
MNNNNIHVFCQNLLNSSPSKYIEDYQHLQKKVANSSARYNGKPVPFLYQPMLYSQEDKNILIKTAEHLTEILKKICEKYLADPKFRSYFGFPPLMEDLILLDPGYDKYFPVARFDVFYEDRNNIKFCELNADGTSGMNENRVLSRFFQNSRLMSKLQNSYNITSFDLFQSLLDMIINCYQDYCQNQSPAINKRPTIAITDFEGEGIISEFREIKNFFSSQGYKTFICDPRNFEYNGRHLLYQNQKIDIIYRRATTARIVEEASGLSELFQACRDQSVCLIGGFTSQIIHNKILFAVLHNPEAISFLNTKEKKFIYDHIPKTWKLDPGDRELIRELLKNKNDYIVKPEDRFACHGVYAGKDYTHQKWKKIVAKICDKSYIMQKYIEAPELKLPVTGNEKFKYTTFKYLIGIYLFGQSYSGFYTRAGRKNIIGAATESYTLPGYIYVPREG